MDWNVVGRLVVMGIGALLLGHVAFRETPELNGVKNAWVYRWSYFLLMLRGWNLTFFDLLDVFPVG